MDLEHPFGDRMRMLTGPMDEQLGGNRLAVIAAAARRQKGEAVAKTAGAVDIVRVAGVDPEMEAVTLVSPRLAAPGALFFARDAQAASDAIVAPGKSHVRKFLPTLYLGKGGKCVRGWQGQTLTKTLCALPLIS